LGRKRSQVGHDSLRRELDLPIDARIRFRFEEDFFMLLSALPLLTPSLRQAVGELFAPVNRRREVRRLVRLGCRVVHRGDWRLLGDRTVDLSPQGVLVLSDEPVETGDDVLVSFQATDLPIWFDTTASVARVIEGRRPNDRGRALGLTFHSLPAVQRLILRGHLRRLPPAPAQRALPLEVQPEPAVDYAAIVRDIWLNG
jgi:hypothetical protein